MPKNYYQYGEEIGIYPAPEIGAFSIGTVTTAGTGAGSSQCTVAGTFIGTKDTTYSIFIQASASPCTINWNDDITNPSKSIVRSSVTSNVATVYVKNHGYSTGDNVRTYGTGAYAEENVAITVLDENSFTYAHTTGDATATGGSVWRWNAHTVALNTGKANSLNNGITVDIDEGATAYDAAANFVFTVSNTTGKTIRTHYFKEPNVLALSTDTPQIKKEQHEGLVMYACKQITRRIDVNRYPIYSQEWEEWYSKIVSSGKYIREENVQSTFRNY